ncbi:DUF4832 domain-containing protein [Desertivirga xinjiangensis]|uniref:DUF4832 domain-containing protein n=1 Tax=Desertivirga xinjiangensis TaxID=539206 RepID=UPI00210E17EA|nr:DUF4832 domain-containing protein [Pedobacter xinjiangensis]
MTKLNYKKISKVALLAIMCLHSVACTKKDDDTKVGVPTGTLVKPKYNRSSVIHNPLNGWVMYGARDANETYWDKEIYVADLGKRVKIRDYASACYIRTSWSSMNPSDGVYTWRDPNSRLGRLIKGVQDRGLPIALRIVVDGRDQGMNTPQFVFDAGAKSYLENANYPTRITPIPQDPIFQQYYTKFIEELAKDFNDPVKTSFIDAYGLGKWGEAHNVVYAAPGELNDNEKEVVKEQVFDWITDLYTRTFNKVPLVINYHRVIGDPVSWGAANPNSDKLLVKAINKGYSLRQDAFGMSDYYGSWEKQFVNGWIFKRPVIMEGGWIISSHSYWNDSSKKYRQGHPEDVRLGEFDASAEAHVNMMDFRAGSETESWFENSFTLVQRFVSEGGYRLYPDRVYLPEKVNSGSEAIITHRWRNTGWGYCPNNIPQWNYKYKVAFALLDAQGNVKKVLVDNNSEPSNWLKDTPVSYEFKTPVDVPAGTYSWAVAIVDKTKENQPGIKLAVNGDITSGGWLKLLDVQVQ